MCSQRMTFTEGRIGSTEPQLSRENLSMFVCISLPKSFFCSVGCIAYTDDDVEETLGHWSSQIGGRSMPRPICLLSHCPIPWPMLIPMLLGRGWVERILSYSHKSDLGMMNQYFQELHQSSIQ